MKKNREMTLDQHQKIAAWLTDPLVIRMACDIPNAYGKTSRVGRLARKMADAVRYLRSEMENMAYADGHTKEATGLYYPSSDVRQCGEVTIARNGYIEELERERDEAKAKYQQLLYDVSVSKVCPGDAYEMLKSVPTETLPCHGVNGLHARKQAVMGMP